MDIPQHMDALILKEEGFSVRPASYQPESLGAFLDFRQIETPKPAPGQVLIKMRCSSVNPSDLMFIQGAYGQPRVKGQAAGFEAVGDVVASGGGFWAGRLRGRRVAFVARNSGSWAEYVIADAETCMPLRKQVRDEDGAAMIVNPMTAWAMFDIVKKSGSNSFIMSAGASQLCKLIAGLADEQGIAAISIIRRDSQIKPLLSLGCAHVLNCEAGDYTKRLAAICKKEKPVVFLDAVSGPGSAEIFDQMGTNAKWVIYGKLSDHDTMIKEPGQFIFMNKRIEGFWLVNWIRKASLPAKLKASKEVQARFADGRWKTDIATHIPLSRVLAALPGHLSGANEGKIMLIPG